MLTSLSIENFKSWRSAGPMRLAPITALFGSNSSGKTSLLQLLLMLKQTTDSPDRAQPLHLGDDRSLVELGTIPDILFEHDLANLLSWAIAWQLPKALKISDPERKSATLFQPDALAFSATVGWKESSDDSLGRAYVRNMEYEFDGQRFGMRLKSGEKSEYELYANSAKFKFLRTAGRPWPLPAPAKCYGFPDQVRAYYQNAGFLSNLELEFENLFSRMFYLGPLREYPQRQYTWAGARPADMGRRGERVADALLAAREQGDYLSRGRGRSRTRLTLEQRVAMWLKDLGLIEHFEIRSIAPGSNLFQVWVRRAAQAPEVLITDVGFGVSQILPVLVLCYYAPEGSTLILEQPEIHLHPSVQAGLAEVFVDAVKTRHIQIILESHSEHLLRRLQRCIAEERLAAKDAALYFVTNSAGESQLEPLQLNSFGEIKNWPAQFFGDDLGDLVAMTEAAARREAKMNGRNE